MKIFLAHATDYRDYKGVIARNGKPWPYRAGRLPCRRLAPGGNQPRGLAGSRADRRRRRCAECSDLPRTCVLGATAIAVLYSGRRTVTGSPSRLPRCSANARGGQHESHVDARETATSRDGGGAR